jgi:hypothetical protein
VPNAHSCGFPNETARCNYRSLTLGRTEQGRSVTPCLPLPTAHWSCTRFPLTPRIIGRSARGTRRFCTTIPSALCAFGGFGAFPRPFVPSISCLPIALRAMR